MNNDIVLFLDVDGVLNQYDTHERIRRCKKLKYNSECMNPFTKKVLRLSKIVKQHNIDVYVFSAWSLDDLQKFLPFKLKGDTRKNIKNVNTISLQYKHSILIDDELLAYEARYGEINVNKKLQPHYEYGFCKKDAVILENHIKMILRRKM